MTDIVEHEKFGELLHEYGDTSEVQEILGELFSPEMMSRQISSTEFQACFERLQLQLLTFDKDEAVKRGGTIVQ